MALALFKTQQLKRYKDIVALLIKYGRSDLVKEAGLSTPAIRRESLVVVGQAPQPEELASDLENLGARGDLLPEPYLDALARLQDKVEPFSFAEVDAIVSSELGIRISKAFARFDPEPLAAASLAQVHRAWMRDGRAVVVKVQRPGVREQIVNDLEALEEVASFIDAHTEIGRRYEFVNMLADLRRSLLREIDFQREGNNLLRLGDSLRDFRRIVIPEPIDDFTTSRVLTMDYVSGKKVTALSPLRLMEVDGAKLSEELLRAYLKQTLVDGFFHADPHPGNVFLTDDNRIALLDLGMVSNIGSTFQENYLRLLLAISNGRGDEAAEISIKMGEPKPRFDESDFRHRVSDLVAEHADTALDRIDAGQVVLRIERIAADTWFRLAPEFTMIAKTLMNLDRVVYILAPNFDPNAIIREEASNLILRSLMNSAEPARIMSGVLEVKEFVERFPARINKILDAIGNAGGSDRRRCFADARRNFISAVRLPWSTNDLFPAGRNRRARPNLQHSLVRQEAEEKGRGRLIASKPSKHLRASLTRRVSMRSLPLPVLTF